VALCAIILYAGPLFRLDPCGTGVLRPLKSQYGITTKRVKRFIGHREEPVHGRVK
jgi:hypothetical protein